MMFSSFIQSYWRGFLIGLCITYLSTASASGLEKVPVPVFEGIDKTIHFLMYAGLTVACMFDFRRNKRNKHTKLYFGIYCFLYPFLLGGILEIVQWKFLSDRTGSWYDMIFNTLGIIVGYLLMKFLVSKLKK